MGSLFVVVAEMLHHGSSSVLLGGKRMPQAHVLSGLAVSVRAVRVILGDGLPLWHISCSGVGRVVGGSWATLA